MKQIYIKPEIDVMSVSTSNRILAASAPGNGGEGSTGDNAYAKEMFSDIDFSVFED